ncbi:hypothetical protein LNV09_11930 [Paucibacter sp. B2R-40]|uniref:hypothetical protein n=1 Tax=Paucibacter sp. B2R-40 TaxID=2893554 RepID=UPI0021E3CA33|nr:hypothetical protein [Paucibacter sp. B2R-40]MCV2354865.1 hypothetical protein [Paucibacter sp. B2R-40]
MIRLILLAITLLMALPQSAHAQSLDPLWQQLLQHLQAQKQVVPDESDTLLVLPREAGGSGERDFMSRKLSGWKDGKPSYEIVAAEPPIWTSDDLRITRAKQADQQISSALGQGNQLFKPDTLVKRSEAQALDGKLWTLFEAEDKGFGRQVLMRAWVDPQSGRPHRIDVKGRFLMILSLDVSSLYQVDSKDRSLASKVAGEVKATVRGKGPEVRFEIDVKSWAEVPSGQPQS